MHILLGAAVLAGLMGFAFGEAVARVFVGGLLAVGALFVLLIVACSIADSSRIQNYHLPTAHYGVMR